jgi:hypothetical protein
MGEKSIVPLILPTYQYGRIIAKFALSDVSQRPLRKKYLRRRDYEIQVYRFDDAGACAGVNLYLRRRRI